MNTKEVENILIVGPFGEFGGRELETSFIAGLFEKDFKVNVLSTTRFTRQSQLYDFIKSSVLESLDRLLFKKINYKFFSFLSYLRHQKGRPPIGFLHNNVNKKLGLRDTAISILKKHVDQNDLVFICAQVVSNYVKEIVEYASSTDKKIVFRTTNAIKLSSQFDYNWLSEVHLFIHHSEVNAKRLNFLDVHDYIIIDQCSFNESSYLKIPVKNEVKSFLAISRIVNEKNIDVLVDVFKLEENKDIELCVVGKGEALENLKRSARDHSNIKFFGYIDNNELETIFMQKDGFIVSHYEDEAGPLTGIEAMASSLVIVSAKTGAMRDRLPENDFFFDNTIEDLNQIVQKLVKLKSEDVKKISQYNRNRYLENYSQSEISSQYKSAIFTVIND